MTPYCYIFVRKDLSFEQQLVQSLHAVAESAQLYFKNVSEHPHFVVCGVKDESALLKTINKIENHNIRYALFREADLGDQVTAIATEPILEESRMLFKNYQLLKVTNGSMALPT